MNVVPVRQLSLQSLDEVTWRLCDTTVPTSDAANVVACVERVADDLFEVVWLGAGAKTSRFGNLDDVLSEAAQRQAEAARSAKRMFRRSGA